MINFQPAVDLTLSFEGGTNYTLHDRGGLTKWGCSEKNYPEVSDPSFSEKDAINIYYRDYWKESNCFKFVKPVALFLFDSAVNCGQPSAVKWIQLTCNLAGDNLKIDGNMGPITTTAVKSLSPYVALCGMSGYRLHRYSRLVERHPEQMKFILGWINRVSKLQLAIIG